MRLLLSFLLSITLCRTLQADFITFQAGEHDLFAAPADPASPSAALLQGYTSHTGQSAKRFDEFISNRGLLQTFTGLPEDIVAGTLLVKLKANYDSFASNDQIVFRFVEDPTQWEFAWARKLGQLELDLGVGDGQWSSQESRIFTLDLTALPLDGGTRNLVPNLNEHGFLDVVISDDTAVDFMRLTVETAPPAPVPEPSSMLLAVAGLAGLAVWCVIFQPGLCLGVRCVPMAK